MRLVLIFLLLINFNFQSELKKVTYISVVLLSQEIIKRLMKDITLLFIESCLIFLILRLLYQPRPIGISRFGILSRKRLFFVLRWVRLWWMFAGVPLVVLFLLLCLWRNFIFLTQDKIDTKLSMNIRHPRIGLLLQL